MTLYIRAHNDTVRNLISTQIQNHRWTDSGFDIPMPHQTVDLDKYAHSFGLGISVASTNSSGDPTPSLLLPRSSIYKTEFRLGNSIGLIDSGYRGEVQAKVDIVHIPAPINPNFDSVKGIFVEGTRFFQICQHNFLPWTNIRLVDELPAALDNRGTGGFGSTTSIQAELHSRT